jgi:hypothetical protein
LGYSWLLQNIDTLLLDTPMLLEEFISISFGDEANPGMRSFCGFIAKPINDTQGFCEGFKLDPDLIIRQMSRHVAQEQLHRGVSQKRFERIFLGLLQRTQRGMSWKNMRKGKKKRERAPDSFFLFIKA